MLNAIRSGLVFVALAALISVAVHNEAQGCRWDCCCRTCCQTPCCCPQRTCQAAIPQRDVVTTEYRSEPVTETVPTTVYENVMVDEGSYQTVWVPRLTTKSVARTVYQTRTAYRTVPYQVTRRVNDFGTQYGQYAPPATAPLVYSPPAYGVSSVPAIAPTATRISSATSSPVPDPRFSAASATPIVPRTATGMNASTMSSGTSDHRTADQGPSLFSPAPSAAQVWRTPRGTITR